MLEREDIERLRDIFVMRQECDKHMEEVNKKLANDNKELAVINTKLSLVLWLLAAVGGGILTVIVKTFFRG